MKYSRVVPKNWAKVPNATKNERSLVIWVYSDGGLNRVDRGSQSVSLSELRDGISIFLLQLFFVWDDDKEKSERKKSASDVNFGFQLHRRRYWMFSKLAQPGLDIFNRFSEL